MTKANERPEFGLIHDVNEEGPEEGCSLPAAGLRYPNDVPAAEQGGDTQGLDRGRGRELALPSVTGCMSN